MDSQARKKGAIAFSTAFAHSLSEALTEAAGAKKQLEVVADGSSPSSESAPVQYRIQVEGALSGECFVEFYESQICALLAELIGQQIDTLTDEYKKLFTKYVTSAANQLGNSTLATCGSFTSSVEPSSGLSFGGMFLVPIATSSTQPELRALLYFPAPLLACLSSSFAGDDADGAGINFAPSYNMNLVMDVELNVSLRFGKRQLPLGDVLELASGSVVELDQSVDEPVELYLDGKLIARGEAVVVDGNYGLRVTEISQPVTSHLLN